MDEELKSILIEYRDATQAFLSYTLLFEEKGRGNNKSKEVTEKSAEECKNLLARQTNASWNLLDYIKDLK